MKNHALDEQVTVSHQYRFLHKQHMHISLLVFAEEAKKRANDADEKQDEGDRDASTQNACPQSAGCAVPLCDRHSWRHDGRSSESRSKRIGCIREAEDDKYAEAYEEADEASQSHFSLR